MRAESSAPAGQVVADQVDGGDERLGLDRQQARGAVEGVAVGLRVHLDLAVGVDLGVEDVGAAAEVDDVEDVDVLAQLGLGDGGVADDVGDLEALAVAAGADQHGGERDQAGEALGADRGLGALAAARLRILLGDRGGAGLGALGAGRVDLVLGLAAVAVGHAVEALAGLLDQRGRAEDAGVLAEAERPRDQQPRQRVGGAEGQRAVLAGPLRRAVAAEVALDHPGQALGEPDLGGVDRRAELPRDLVRVAARVEVLRPREVVLGLGRVGDLAAHPVQPEDADRAALVAMADQVELPALEEQVVGVHLPGRRLVGGHRVVLELDALAAVDGRVDLGDALADLVPARGRRDAEADGALVGQAHRRGAAPGDLLERQAQRLRVRELAVEQAERRLQGRELLVGEGDRRQVEGLARERVVLLLGEAVGGLVDRQVDPERLELGPVGVEAAGEGVLGHVRVALDVAPDLRRRDGPPLGHQVRDQRQLTDELLGVLGQGRCSVDRTFAGRAGGSLHIANIGAWKRRLYASCGTICARPWSSSTASRSCSRATARSPRRSAATTPSGSSAPRRSSSS